MRKIVFVGMLASALWFVGGAAAASSPTACGGSGAFYPNTKVTKITCQAALKSVFLYTHSGLNPPGWQCSFKQLNPNERAYTCDHPGGEIVSWTRSG